MLATRDAQPIDEPVGWCEPARRLVAGTAASCEPAALRYEHVTTVEAFRNLESRWRALDASNVTITSPFQSFGWLDCWVDAHLVEADDSHETPDLAIVCGYDPDGDLVFVLPLMMCSSRAIRQLTWLGAPLAQYGDVLMDAQHASSDVIEQGLAYAIDTFRPDVICLSKVRSDAAIARYLQERPASVVETETARFVTLLPEHASGGTTASTSAKARKNRRRQLRRLNEQHDVAFTQQPCGAKTAATARAGLAMKRAWLNDRGLVSAALQCSCADRFFIKAAQRADTGCQVFAVTLSGKLASVQIGFVHRGRLAMHVIAFDLAFEKFGVGMLHLADTVRQAAEAGTRQLDLLAPDAKYKRDLADGSVTVTSHAIACTLRGQLFARVYLTRLRPALKTLQAVLPLSMRRRLSLWFAG